MSRKDGWLEKITFDNATGEIRMAGLRHALVATEVFLHERESMFKIIGPASDRLLYMSAKEHTINYVRGILRGTLLARMAVKTKWGMEKVARKTGEIISEYGYGKLEYKKIDLDGESVVVLRNSCIAGEYKRMKKKAKVPVCSYIAGLLAGGMTAIAGKDYDCRETKCVAKGDRQCEFVIKKSG